MTRFLLRTLLVLVLVLGAPALPGHGAPQNPRGPLVGHVGPTTAVIWFYTGNRAGSRVHFRPEGTPLSASRSIAMPHRPAGPQAARVTLKGLAPATAYVYRLVFRGKTEDSWKGRFETAPRPGTPGAFRIAASSCMSHEHPVHTAWEHIARERPQFQLLLGDNHYGNSTNRSVIWDHTLRMRGVAQFAQLVRNTPTYATWDDHDFAGDNLGGEVPTKARSLEAFKELWPNPSYGLPGVPGVFFKLSYGDVDFFVLDGRYHRSRLDARNDHRKRMLGDAQFAWFAREITASKARFKVIASGSTIEVEGKDTWQAYRFELDRVFALIRDRRIGGVLWLSGDLHDSLVRVHTKETTGFYEMHEVVSSGVAYSEQNRFAMLDFDTTLDDPTVHVRILDGNAKLMQEVTILRSSLELRP